MPNNSGPTETGLTVYSLTVNGTTGTIASTGTTGGTATDTGTGADNLSVLGDNNTGGHQDIFTLTFGSTTLDAIVYVGTEVINGVTGFVGVNGTDYYFITPSATALAPGNSGPLNADTTGTASPYQWSTVSGTVICFMAQTMIATPEGEVPVETLQAGDLVLTPAGDTRAVRWLGRQTISRLFADPLRVNPIRITAGALAEGVPSRDLLVSPDHALLVDGVLIQAGALVNNTSISREANMPSSFTYYHVELAGHELILADNTPAETFIDNVDRLHFDNWNDHPGDLQLTEMDLPRAKSARQVPAATRARLETRAAAKYGKIAA